MVVVVVVLPQPADIEFGTRHAVTLTYPNTFPIVERVVWSKQASAQCQQTARQ